MVEGLADGGFALITKTHHALIDGIAGVDIAQVIFDLGPSRPRSPTPTSRGSPRASRRGAQLLASRTLGLVRTGLRTARRPRRWPRARPTPCARRARPSRASARSRGPG